MPARIKPSRTLSLEQAGPMVQTIFVRRISPNVHESVGESTNRKISEVDARMAECWVEDARLQYSNIPTLHRIFLYFCARSFQARVENIAQGVAEKINAEHGHENAQTGKKRQPPCGADVDTRVGEHRSPGGNLGRYTNAEKAQTRFRDERGRHREGADDERRLDQIGNDVARDDLAIARAQALRCGDKVAIAQGKRLTADDAAIRNPALGHEG